MNYSTLLFDLDQTLLDTDKNAEMALKKLTLPFSFEFTNQRVMMWHHTQQEMWKELELGKLSRQKLMATRFKRFFDHYQINVNSVALEQQFEQKFFAEHKLMPFAREILKELSPQNNLVVISNGTRQKQERILNDAKIVNFFDDIFLAEEVGYSKPDPKFFQIVTQKLDIADPSKMIVIGDSLTADIKGANNYNLDSIWFNPHHLMSSTIKPTYEVDQLSKILNIVEN